MNDSEQIMTRYLLGQLSEAEQATLEEKYFTDPQVFEQVLKSESELLDRYARGQLSAQAHVQFEQSYLTNPRRHERAKFAEALATKIDQVEWAGSVARESVWTPSPWQRLLLALRDRRPMLGFSLALASLLLVVGGLWFFISSSRSRRGLAQNQTTQEDQQRRSLELEQQVAAERKRAEELTAQLDRERLPQQNPTSSVTTPTPPTRAVPTFASLILTVGGVRGGPTGKTPTLVIPAGTTEARLQLNLRDHDYTGYRMSLQAVGGAEIFSRKNLKPRTTKSGASLSFTVPALKFTNGDYILTLRGVTQDGELEDLSKSIFRVEKR